MPYFRAMRLLTFITLIMASFTLVGQRYAFAQWGTDDGLPTSTINDITEDPLGFIWLATDGAGLVRFDGVRFTQPLHPDSLPSPFVTVLEADSSGNFWIGTERGPAFYNGTKLKRFANLPEGLRTRINAIVPVGANQVWLATRHGIFSWDGTDFSPHKPETEVLSLARIEGGSGQMNLLHTSADGLTENAQVSAEMRQRMGTITRILTVGNHSLFVGARGVFMLQNNNVVQLSTLPDVRDAALVNSEIWLASPTSGIEIISQSGNTLLNSQSGLGFDRTRCLYLSKNGTLWVGSNSGLSKLASAHIRIFDASQGMPDSRVHAVYTTKNGEIWAGTATGVSQYNPGNKTFTHYGAANGLPAGLTLALAQDDEGTMWLGTENGLFYFDKNQFRAYPLPDPFVFGLCNHNGSLYAGTAGGLFRIGRNSATEIPTEGVGFVQILAFQQGLLGLSLDGKLYIINQNSISQVREIGGLDADTLAVHQVAISPDGHMFLAVKGSGVYAISQNTRSFLNVANGLNSTNLRAIACTNTMLWVGTDKGIFYAENIAGKAMHFRLLGEQAGFSAKECNERSLAVGTSNSLLVGSNVGLFVMQAEAFIPKPPALRLTAVDVLFNPTTNWQELGSVTATWSASPEAIRLSFDKNYLTFHFATPVFTGQQLFVRYMLKGQDKRWIMAGTRMEAIYTNIPSGNFTFVVQCSETPDFALFAEVQLPVKIIPPYFKTVWFWAIIALVIGGLVFFFVRYRIRQLNARLALEAALADSERKALRLQMNPHFVFNALDAISGFIFKNEPKEAVRYLTSFAKLMRLTLESSRESSVPLHNELQLLKNYIELEELRFNNSFTHTIKVAEDVDTYETNIPPMLLQPFVENAILHGLRNRESTGGRLLLDFNLVEKRLQVTIEDNGVGRQRTAELNAKRGKTSLATSITAERIDLLSKSLGQPVTLNIADLTDENGNPSGTRVTLSFPHLHDDESENA